MARDEIGEVSRDQFFVTHIKECGLCYKVSRVSYRFLNDLIFAFSLDYLGVLGRGETDGRQTR